MGLRAFRPFPHGSFHAGTVCQVFVGQHGDDSHDGLTQEYAKRTIVAGIASAEQAVANGHPIAEVLVSAGRYEEDLAIPAGVRVAARHARLAGDVTLDDGSSLEIRDWYAKAGKSGGAMLIMTGTSPRAECQIYGAMDTRGEEGDVTGILATASAVESTILDISIGRLYVGAGSGGLTDSASSFGHIHFEIRDGYAAGDGAVIMGSLFANTYLTGRIDHMLEAGSWTGTKGISLTTGLIELTCQSIALDTVYDVSGGTLHFATATRLVGTETHTGGTVTIPDSTTTTI